MSVPYTPHEKMLLQALAQEHAEIICLREECPGVYYLAVQNENSAICQEFYTVMSDAIATVISQETLSYGKKSGDIYIFEKGPARSGYELVEYELRRYRVKKSSTLQTILNPFIARLFIPLSYIQNILGGFFHQDLHRSA